MPRLLVLMFSTTVSFFNGLVQCPLFTALVFIFLCLGLSKGRIYVKEFTTCLRTFSKVVQQLIASCP